MRKPTFTRSAFIAVLAVSGATAIADNLHLQPESPGRQMAPSSFTNHSFEPPDPCMQSQMQTHSGAGTGKVRTVPMMRKAGGTQMGTANMNSAHCLNPQPLPPG